MIENLSGQISIGRWHGTGVDNSNAIHIELIDKTSGLLVAEATMALNDFAECITGLGHAPCWIRRFNDSGLVGKTREHKIIPVKFPKRLWEKSKKDFTEADFEELLESYEVDGWKASHDDLFNHHKRNYTTLCANVLFVRYV